MDYRINIKDSDYDPPYETRKRKFHYRPIPNYLREYVKKEETDGQREGNKR